MQPCPIRSKILAKHVCARCPEASSGQRETASAVGETRKLAAILVADVVGYSGEHSYQFGFHRTYNVATRRAAHAGTLATPQSFEFKA